MIYKWTLLINKKGKKVYLSSFLRCYNHFVLNDFFWNFFEVFDLKKSSSKMMNLQIKCKI